MASNIITTNPTAGNATTQSVRDAVMIYGENGVDVERRVVDLELMRRVAALEENQLGIMSNLKKNTDMTATVVTNTAGIVDFLKDMAAASRLFNRATRALRWMVKFLALCVGIVVVPVTLVYMVTHHGEPPHLFKFWWDIFKE